MTDHVSHELLRLASGQVTAIRLVAEQHYEEAIAAIQQLRESTPATSDRCRFCGCTTLQGCGIIADTELLGPMVARCTWMDDERTICSNTRCVERGIAAGLLQTSAAPPSIAIVTEQEATGWLMDAQARARRQSDVAP